MNKKLNEMVLPDIPIGLATKLGAIATALLAVVALGAAVLDGDHTEETVAALLGAVATLYKLMDGRYKQAAAQIEAEGNLMPVPSEEELADIFEDDAPVDEEPSLPLGAHAQAHA